MCEFDMTQMGKSALGRLMIPGPPHFLGHNLVHTCQSYIFHNTCLQAIKSSRMCIAETFNISRGVDDRPGVNAGWPFTGFRDHELSVETGKDL
jgi:hypothetical protein